MTTKCGKNKKMADERIAECVNDVAGYLTPHSKQHFNLHEATEVNFSNQVRPCKSCEATLNMQINKRILKWSLQAFFI